MHAVWHISNLSYLMSKFYLSFLSLHHPWIVFLSFLQNISEIYRPISKQQNGKDHTYISQKIGYLRSDRQFSLFVKGSRKTISGDPSLEQPNQVEQIADINLDKPWSKCYHFTQNIFLKRIKSSDSIRWNNPFIKKIKPIYEVSKQ